MSTLAHVVGWILFAWIAVGICVGPTHNSVKEALKSFSWQGWVVMFLAGVLVAV